MIMYSTMELSEIFRNALSAVLRKKKRGTQSRLADELNIPRTSMSDFIKGRQPFSETKREQVANALGYRYEEFLAMGRHLQSGGAVVEPGQYMPGVEVKELDYDALKKVIVELETFLDVEDLELDPEDKAKAIIRLYNFLMVSRAKDEELRQHIKLAI